MATLTLSPGARLGSYEIVSALGAGGLAYARDDDFKLRRILAEAKVTRWR